MFTPRLPNLRRPASARSSRTVARLPIWLFLAALLAAPCGGLRAAYGLFPEWSKNVSIYEVNVRQFSEEGTFDQVTEQLPRIQALGIDLIWLMPIHPIGELERKGSMGSYYSIRDFKGLNPEFGDEAAFRRLVETAHSLGMYVIIDWVANHTAWDHAWTESNPEFYKIVDGSFVPPVEDWSDVIQLDLSNRDLRREMIAAMRYWVEVFNIDGFRCDVAEKVPTEFWNEARAELNQVRQIFMLAEGQDPEFHEYAFEASYAWHQMGEMRRLVAGEINAADLAAYERYEQDEKFPTSAYRMKFLTNHDENSWTDTVAGEYGEAAGVLRAFTVASRGFPLIYNGEEAGLDKQLEFFERDPIVWREHPEREKITRLLHWKQRNRALWNGDFGGLIVDLQVDPQVWAFTRERDGDRIVALLNLSPEPATVNIRSAADVAGRYLDVLTDEPIELAFPFHHDLPAWGFRLLERIEPAAATSERPSFRVVRGQRR